MNPDDPGGLDMDLRCPRFGPCVFPAHSSSSSWARHTFLDPLPSSWLSPQISHHILSSSHHFVVTCKKFVTCSLVSFRQVRYCRPGDENVAASSSTR